MNKKGFTLIELLIVVAIIGIIAAIAIPNLLVALQKGKQKATMGDLKTIGSAIESYVTDWSFAPQDDTFVSNNAGAVYFEPFYIKICPKTDGWGNRFLYETPAGDQYTIYSGGRGPQAAALTPPTPALYDCTALSDFNNDIAYSNGLFTYGPVVKR
ncbi:MAG: prepilin-type N-terminal cleavage/methylation domain-containing protein [Chrysiogenia bacterium]